MEVTDQDKERIKFNTELLKLLCLIFTATAGGVASLIVKGWGSAREVIIVGSGIIIIATLIVLGLQVYKNTKRLIG